MTLTRWTIITAAFAASTAALGAWAYLALPEATRIAVHFGADGRADGWLGKFEGLANLPLTCLAVSVILILAPRILPGARNAVSMTGPYGVVVAGVAAVLFAAEAAIVARAFDPSFDVLRAVFLASGVLLVVAGNLLGKIRQNWLLGVRTPWTLMNETVWDKTHRFTGRLMFVTGVLLIPISAFIPDHRWLIGAMIVCAAGPMFAGAVYSALIFPRATRA